MRSTVLKTVAALFVAVLLTGCRSDLTTRIDLSSESPTAAVSVTFTGSAADAARDSRVQLLDLYRTRTGLEPQWRDNDDRVTVVATGTVDQVLAASTLTGVSYVTYNEDGADNVEATVTLVDPEELRQAIQVVAPDVAAADTALDTTRVGLEVVMPGPIRSITAGDAGPEAEHGTMRGNVAAVTTPLSEWNPGTVTVRSTSASNHLWLIVGAVAVALLGGTFAVRRR